MLGRGETRDEVSMFLKLKIIEIKAGRQRSDVIVRVEVVLAVAVVVLVTAVDVVVVSVRDKWIKDGWTLCVCVCTCARVCARVFV